MDREKLLGDDIDSAQYLNEAIEQVVAENICQYQWAYRRFDEQAYSHPG